MEIAIKLATRDFERLRAGATADSPLLKTLEKAVPIDHAVEGVLFRGYEIPCNEEQAQDIIELARRCCPEVIPEIEKALGAVRP
ncbi:MAG TPA: hypothetical protein VNO43_14615 [Candidatus Eisenbacteria bacterium]|nr:hypothetical protein [Candidatus Eisenbacteria bacterium]